MIPRSVVAESETLLHTYQVFLNVIYSPGEVHQVPCVEYRLQKQCVFRYEEMYMHLMYCHLVFRSSLHITKALFWYMDCLAARVALLPESALVVENTFQESDGPCDCSVP